MSDFENNKFTLDDDFFNDDDITYQSYSSNGGSGKKGPRSSKSNSNLSKILLALLFVVLIVVIIIVVTNSVGGDGDDSTNTTEPVSTTLPQNYTTIELTTDDIKRGELVLINNSYNYQYDTTQGGLENLYGSSVAYVLSGSNLSVTKHTRDNLNKWLEDFKQTGKKNENESLIIIDAFRSDADQTKLFNWYVDQYGSETEAMKYAQKSGYSEHQSGLCVDIKIWNSDKAATSLLKAEEPYKWIIDNAHKYGFIQRYPEGKTSITGVAAEPGHFRYIGVAHATAMKQNNASCLESYIDFLKNYTFDSEHLMVTCDNGDEYEIYYSASLEVHVPTDKEYTISGNNVDGFIVTIKR